MTLQEGAASQKTRVSIVKALLIVGMAIDAIAILSGFAQQSLLTRAASGLAVTEAEAAANDARHGLIGMIQMLVFFATAICWLVWMHRAYSNLRLMGTTETNYSPGWSVGYWFVPIMSLFRPYQLTKELWLRSARSNAQQPTAEIAPPTILSLWWGVWIVSGLFGRALMRWSFRAEAIDELQAVTVAGIGLDAVGIVSAVLAFVVASNIDVLQRRAASILTDLSHEPTTP